MRAAAYIVGPEDGAGATLREMARQLGFASVFPFAGIAHAERQAAITPLCYFLFAAVADVESLRGVAEAVRFSTSSKLRFSPLIYLSQSPSVEAITRCINMGFDDVITLPFTRARLRERIVRQVGQTVTFYETPGYFGPDRRDRVTAPKRAAETRRDGQFRRIEIVRSLHDGISVLRDDHFMHPAA